MNKNERTKLAAIVLDMQNSYSTTYEVACRADELLATFSSILPEYNDLKDNSFIDKLSSFISNYLLKSADELLLGRDNKVMTARNNTHSSTWEYVYDYCSDTEQCVEDLVNDLCSQNDPIEEHKWYQSLLTSPEWLSVCRFYFNEDSDEFAYLTCKLKANYYE